MNYKILTVLIFFLFFSCEKSYELEWVIDEVIENKLIYKLNGYKIAPIDRGVERTYFRFPNGLEYYVYNFSLEKKEASVVAKQSGIEMKGEIKDAIINTMSMMLNCGIIGFVSKEDHGYNIIYTLVNNASTGHKYALQISRNLLRDVEPYDMICCRRLVLKEIGLYVYETKSHVKYSTFP